MKMGNNYFTDLINKARRADIAEYLKSSGKNVRRDGDGYIIEEYDIRIQGNRWNSKDGKSRNSIDFLVYVLDMPFHTAVMTLVNAKPYTSNKATENKENAPNKQAGGQIKPTAKAGDFIKKLLPCKFDFNTVQLKADKRRVVAFLTKNKHIPKALVLNEIRNKNLFQEEKTNDVLFPIKDETGEIVGAEGSSSLSFKKDRTEYTQKGSKFGYGYNIGDRRGTRYILYFESAVDLFSFMAIKQSEGKNLKGCLLVSMAGLKISVVRNMQGTFGKSAQPVLCTGNDEKSIGFIDSCLKEYPNAITQQPFKEYKNWNSQLSSKTA